MSHKKAKETRRQEQEKKKEWDEVWNMLPTVVVAAYPRSGSTTLMRMLYYGGMELITDDRTEDGRKKVRREFWPYGDAEVANLDVWIQEHPDPRFTSGKAIKIITPYFNRFFLDRPTRVLFLHRDYSEIIASLLRIQSVWPMTPDVATNLARKALEGLEIPTHHVRFAEMIKYPKATATMIADFLARDGFQLDPAKMVNAVDNKIRERFRSKKSDKLLTFKFDYVRDFRGNKDDPIIPLTEEARKAKEDYEARENKKFETAVVEETA